MAWKGSDQEPPQLAEPQQYLSVAHLLQFSDSKRSQARSRLQNSEDALTFGLRAPGLPHLKQISLGIQQHLHLVAMRVPDEVLACLLLDVLNGPGQPTPSRSPGPPGLRRSRVS